MRARSVQQWVGLAVACLLLLPGLGAAQASSPKEAPKRHRIVYQLSDPGADKARFVLGNIRNHIAGAGGWDNIEALELVVFGPALRSFVTAAMDPDVKQALADLQGQGLVLGACGNTMKALHITIDELPEHARYLPQGGVVRIMELQEQGYVYIRP